MASQLARLGAQRAIPRCLIRDGPAIPIPTATPADLAADRRRRTTKLDCDRSKRAAGDKTSRYLLALAQAEGSARPPALRRTNAARRRQHRENRRRLPIKPPADRTHRLPALPPVPNLGSLCRRVINPLTLLHPHTPSPQRMKCCDHPLNPPPNQAIPFRASHMNERPKLRM